MAEQEEGLKEEQVYNVLQFSEAMYGYLKGGAWNPYNSNANLLNLNKAPVKATYQDLIDSLSSALTDASALQGYSEFMSVFDTIYKKTLWLYENILSFDYHKTCINAKPEDYKTPEYKDDEKRFYKFLDNFDFKREFKNIILPQVMETGVFFGWFRDSDGTINDKPLDLDDGVLVKKRHKYSIQILPQKKCLLSAYWDGGMLFDFDMSYFLSPTIDLREYDPSLIKAFRDIYYNYDETKKEYVPSANLNNRNGKYAMWTQTSPNDGAICVKFDENNFNVIPPLGNLMKATFNNTEIHKLQLDKDMAAAWAVLYGSIETLDGAKTGEHPNKTAFTPEVMGTFMSYVQNALQSTMKTVALPLKDTHFGQFIDQTPTMESTAIENSASQGASASSLIYSTGKRNAEEVKEGILTDYNLVRKLYPQFANIINFYANKKTKKFKFKLEFDGSVYDFERDARAKRLTQLTAIGLTPNTSYIASVMGIPAQDFDRMLEEAHNGDLKDKITMLMTSSTMSGKVGQGAPTKDTNDLSEGGNVSKDYT